MIIHYMAEENIFAGTEEILRSHVKDCFKINCKQGIIIPKQGEYVIFKKYK